MKPKNTNLLFIIAICLITLILYAKTLLPSYGFWDIGELQTIVPTFNIAHPTGYPSYLILGKIFTILFPFGNVAWKLNLFSSITAIIGLIYLFILLKKTLSINTFVSFFTCLILASGQIFWDKALRAEVHTLHFCLSSIFIYYLINSYKTKSNLFFPSFLVGLSIGNHILSIFHLPILALFIIKKRISNKKNLIVLNSMIGLSLGLSVYGLLIIIARLKPPLTFDYDLATWQGFKRHLLGQDFQHAMLHWTKGNFFLTINYFYEVLSKQFSLITILLAIIGFIFFWRKPFLNFTFFLYFFLPSLFALTYQNQDLDRYFLNPFFIISIYFAISVNQVLKFLLKTQKRLLAYTLVFLPFSLLLIKNVAINYPLVDQSKNFEAENFTNQVFKNTNKNGSIISWWYYSTPLWYSHLVEGKRKDIIIYNLNPAYWEGQAIKELKKGRDVYSIMKFKLTKPYLKLQKKGNIYQILPT